METEMVDLRLQSPCTVMLAGPTGCGKSALMRRMIRNASEVSVTPPVEIVYCYSVYQKVFDEMEREDGVVFHEGLLNVTTDWKDDGAHRWLIVDDLMREATKNGIMDDMFTKHSHHLNISVFFLVQNLFKKELRTVSLNTHYMFLFKNPRDASVVMHLAKQMYPGKTGFMVESYNDATRVPYAHLRVDQTQGGNRMTRLVGNYGSENVTSYVPI